jgi:penicillin amidase
VGWLVLGALLFVAVGLVFAVLGERRTRRAAYPVVEGRVVAAGLEGGAEVRRDRRGVPHVEATSAEDAYFALGFVHAQDRPVQMLWLRRLARGRLAELVGAEALAGDRLARVLGIGLHADAAAGRLPRLARRVLEAYAAGVNARFAAWGTGAPRPRVLDDWGLVVEPWTPADCVALAKLFAWGLGGTLEEALVLSDLLQRLGATEAGLFFPEGRGFDLPAPAPPPALARRQDAPSRAQRRAALAPHGPRRAERRPVLAGDPLRSAAGLLGASAGSSAWMVSGRHSRSGGVLLAGDAHFEPTLPGALYEAHLRGGELDVAGATLPGVPVVWTGFNRHVAWASTHARAVVSDLCVETLDPRDPSRHHDGGRWRPLRERSERIAVRGGSEELLVVRETPRGPLVGALVADEREPLSLRWTGALQGDGLAGMLELARARSAAELRQALEVHHEPVLAVAYADARGEAGVQVAGSVPRRGQPSHLLPVPGADPGYAWSGRVPAAELPAVTLGGEPGFVVVADGVASGASGSTAIEWLWRPDERAARLEALIRERIAAGPLGIRDVAAMQADLRSERAGALVDVALELAGERARLGREEREMMDVLEAWDRSAGADSEGAAVFHVLLDRLLRALFEPRLGRELLRRYLASGRVNATHLVLAALESARRDLDADPAGERGEAARAVAQAVRHSLRESWIRLSVDLGANREKWRWGRLHPLHFRPLWPGAAERESEGLGPFAYDGDGSSVLAAEYRPLESFETRVISTYRLAVDTAELDQALTAAAPGQSEHSGHPHQADRVDDWLRGRSALLATSPLAVEENAAALLVLEPRP